ncbi:MAG: tRNA (cytidine(34)-2'-O)-methyltransferase [Sedimenticola sp.]|uniref:tRNA (cytidine(34)-2'-O)-methyltransferase n=1 Tax=Sedimenticola thiotaurini TaxID=1543721 RepID=A0A558DFG9_9GAMM|nr:tRNA (cytidine(34)-2'-O)-methyltransferase [Sedimenticola sp.]TVT59774.1 MAG: tRNA (cytidine(34)-2'-O)-methyltransferase [Sedimenticola thiotaurini]MCW8882620.1 tRNA (cytidine(34)-2'-O)-methyltransferase [Sedimenticola sp.]MCW8921685.1 tRNA (cytidine(34)-2'-O)-methyltransferase [Sedimenticola sp.]MCW8948241.1 tRNA (cytidine(34)-2'-O)-methyltransferase [Sedimenticola sp.]
MFNIALYEPEIPPNTGNIIRLCANSGSRLHLIHPLGFTLEHKQLRRAGLDYHDLALLQEYPDLASFLSLHPAQRLFACSTRGKQCYSEARYQPGDTLLFGPETRGLPKAVLDQLPEEQVIRIPMQAGNRSLNLSNAVAIILYEAWRQQDFAASTG